MARGAVLCAVLLAGCTRQIRAQLGVSSPPTVSAIALPRFRTPVPGRWLPPDSEHPGISLGGLGTGFMELRADGRFHEARFHNLAGLERPPTLRLTVSAGSGPPVTLLASDDLTTDLPSPRGYCGHYPMADLDFGAPPSLPGPVSLRAWTPFVPGDAELSCTPAVVFTVTTRNGTPKTASIALRLSLKAPGMAVTSFEAHSGRGRGVTVTGDDVSFAIAGLGSPSEPASASGGTVGIHAAVASGSAKTLTVAIAWRVRSETGRDGKSYGPHYAERYADAPGVAVAALDRAQQTEGRIIDWQSRIYAGDGPDWLKDAAINSLYLLPRDTVWYRDGLAIYEQDGKVVESIGSRLDGGSALSELFPELEQAALRRLAARQTEDGEIPGRLGLEGSLGAPAFGPGRATASAEFALLCGRATLRGSDAGFLKEIFPAAKRALQFAMTLDTDHDGLINEPAMPRALAWLDRYRRDWVWHGTSSWTAFMTLAALRAGEEMAKRAGDDDFAGWCRDHFEAGRSSVQENLWNGRYYRLYTDPDAFRQSDASYLAALQGQVLAWNLGLGDLDDMSRAKPALTAQAQLHAESCMAGLLPNGKPDDSGAPFSTNLAPRDAWIFASAAWLAGQSSNDAPLRDQGLAMGGRAYNMLLSSGTLWSQSSLYFSDKGAAAGDRHYFGNLSIWQLLQTVQGPQGRRP